MSKHRYWLTALLLGLAACSGPSNALSSDEDFANEDELARASEDESWKELLGSWESVAERVAPTGSLPPEHMIRSLEFKSERDDTSRYARRRMIEVVRPDCGSCIDETFDAGTYRTVADESSSRRGKIYTTTGGNTSSRDYYEISADGKALKLQGTMGDGSRVVREFRKTR